MSSTGSTSCCDRAARTQPIRRADKGTARWAAAAVAGLSLAGQTSMAEADLSVVQWDAKLSASQPVVAGGKATILVSGAIPDGWHVYALTQPPGGPTALKISVEDAELGSIGSNIQAPSPVKKQDPALDLETQTYTGLLTLAVPVSLHEGLAPGPHELHLSIRYQSCSDRECRPPRTVHLSTHLDVASAR